MYNVTPPPAPAKAPASPAHGHMTVGTTNYNLMPPPSGLTYHPGVVAEPTWLQLRHWLLQPGAAIPWERAAEGRRVAQWGFRYDYMLHAVDKQPVGPIPDILVQLLATSKSVCSTTAAAPFTQCIINEYITEDGIPWHTDDPAFGPEVLVFSFGATRTISMRPLRACNDDSGRNCCFSFTPAHCSLFYLRGEAREEWQHCIRSGGTGLRYSFTFRTLRQEESGGDGGDGGCSPKI